MACLPQTDFPFSLNANSPKSEPLKTRKCSNKSQNANLKQVDESLNQIQLENNRMNFEYTSSLSPSLILRMNQNSDTQPKREFHACQARSRSVNTLETRADEMTGMSGEEGVFNQASFSSLDRSSTTTTCYRMHPQLSKGYSRSSYGTLQSLNQPIKNSNQSSCFSEKFDACKYEVEVRSKVVNSKKMLLRNFLHFYLQSLIRENQQLTASYFSKLREEYSKVQECDKICLSDLKESLSEMVIDEEARIKVYDQLRRETNIEQLLSCRDGRSANNNGVSTGIKDCNRQISPYFARQRDTT